MSNLIKNAGFENGRDKTYANWIYSTSQVEYVCVSRRNSNRRKSILYQDVPSSRIRTNGWYRFQMILLSPTANTTARMQMAVYRRNGEAYPVDRFQRLRKGEWQLIEVGAFISRVNLRKIRLELFFAPENAEVIIQKAYFGKQFLKLK